MAYCIIITSMKNVVMIRNAAQTDFGGAERYPIFLSQELAKYDYNVTILSRSVKLLDFAKSSSVHAIRSWWWQKQNWSGVNVILFPAYLIWQVILTSYYLVMFVKLKPTIVHVQSKDDFIAGSIAARILRKRVIWTDHADLKHIWKNITIWYKNPVGKTVYLAAHSAETIVAVGDNEKALIVSNLRNASPIIRKIIRIYNGTADKMTQYKKRVNKNFTFVIASRLVTDKGIGESIDAFKKLAKDNLGVELKIIGDGPEADTFKELAGNQANITFLGHLSDPLHEIANADVFLHPTYHEAFSIVIVEACMLKLPVIATNVGGNPEIIIDNTTGLLIEPKNIESLYDAMEKLYENKDLRDKLATNARKLYEEKFNFSDTVKNKYLPVYKG